MIVLSSLFISKAIIAAVVLSVNTYFREGDIFEVLKKIKKMLTYIMSSAKLLPDDRER